MSYLFTKGATSQSIELYIVDSTDGTPETGVLWNTAGIDLKYRRKDAAVVSITEAALTSPALTDTWETGGFLEIGNGVYRLDLPDAALASAAGIDRVVVFGTVTGMVVLPITIHLTAVDLSDTVRAGLTALPNAVPQAAGGMVTSGAGADFDDRTLPSADYVVVGDTIAGVTLVTTTTTNTDMVGTNSAALASVLGAAVGASISADIAAVKAETSTIVTDTNEIQGKLPTNKFMGSSDGADDDGTLNTIATDAARLTAARAGALTDLINGGRLDLILDAILAMLDDVRGEPAQGAPPVNPDAMTKIDYIYKFMRNQTWTTATQISVYNDAVDTVDHKSTISDDTTTFKKGEFVSGA